MISSEISGLTGEALLEKIYAILEKHKKEIVSCKAVLIEDDLDGKFYGMSEQEIRDYKKHIVQKVCKLLEKDMPVFILYASPEAESWFLADWNNGFGNVYSDAGCIHDVEAGARTFFVHHLKRYIEQNILMQYKDDIENYGFFDGTYYKLSEQLMNAIQVEVKDYIRELSHSNEDYIEQITSSRSLYYSKKLHGDKMLRNIVPEFVALKCRRYFAFTYKEIAEF